MSDRKRLGSVHKHASDFAVDNHSFFAQTDACMI
jgi:hypothetical protein